MLHAHPLHFDARHLAPRLTARVQAAGHSFVEYDGDDGALLHVQQAEPIVTGRLVLVHEMRNLVYRSVATRKPSYEASLLLLTESRLTCDSYDANLFAVGGCIPGFE